MTETHLRQLAETREIGLRLVRDVEADPPQGRKPPPKATLLQAYAMLTTAIRRTMAPEQEVIGLREKRASRVRPTCSGDKPSARRARTTSRSAASPSRSEPC